MLNLFPLEYWIFLSMAALGRLVSGQLLSFKLIQLKKQRKAKRIISIVTGKHYITLIRLKGVGHAIFVIGLITIFFLTYSYIIPIDDINTSNVVLTYVLGIGYTVAAFEFAMTVLYAYIVFKIYTE